MLSEVDRKQLLGAGWSTRPAYILLFVHFQTTGEGPNRY